MTPYHQRPEVIAHRAAARVPFRLWPADQKARHYRSVKRWQKLHPHRLLSPARKAAIKRRIRARRLLDPYHLWSPERQARRRAKLKRRYQRRYQRRPYHTWSPEKKAKWNKKRHERRRKSPAQMAAHKLRIKRYYQTPKGKAARAAYLRAARPLWSPETKARRAAYCRAAWQRRTPEQKAKAVSANTRRKRLARRNLLELGLYALARLSFSAASQTQRNATTTETKTVCPR